MKRLALLLASVAALGTGCYSSPPPCDAQGVDVSWNAGFDGPDAAAGKTCAQAGVSYVDIFFDGQQVTGPLASGHFPCGDYGESVAAVPRGTRRLTVEGVGPDGASILYRDDRSISVNGCGILQVATAPAAGYVDLAYAFYDGATQLPPSQQVCAAGSWLWLSIFDVAANGPAVLADGPSNPQAYSCGGTFTLPLPSGDYTLRWMEERGPASSYALESSDCTDRPFTIAAAGTVSVPVNLNVVAPVTCTR